MEKIIKTFLLAFILITSLSLLNSCDKRITNRPSLVSPSDSDTLLNVTYENNHVTSGITNLNPTSATALDAAYIVGSPGGDYAIAHKVTLGIPSYYSNEAYRSESDADMVANARFMPGDERRYEFSVLLKDWQEFNSTKQPYGDNIFQLKVTGGAVPPVRILTKRNAIITRNTSYQDILLDDFTPYINKWIHFRIDVEWATKNNGYLKIYIKPEGASTFNLVLNKTNYATYTGTPAALPGQHGYIKWGVYREVGHDNNGNVITSDNVLTRIAYHDNIRIIRLN
ncbi:heparin lyase I family protein [Pedobacter arcticus]|uniref:heparin lyase I family protein n=1 Tax=Pedobacter arcticus TaxID=752140 RepID=UPI00031494BB|nr:heparin lyase I family protein [Pedobacter arcticus]